MFSSTWQFWPTILQWMWLFGKPCTKKWDVQLPLCQKEWLLWKWNCQTRLRQESCSFSSQTVSHLSGLLNRKRNNNDNSSNKKCKIVKEHRIQVRWFHYDEKKKEFITVWQKNGGGNRFIPYTDEEQLRLETLTEKACALFFLDGVNNFPGVYRKWTSGCVTQAEWQLLILPMKELWITWREMVCTFPLPIFPLYTASTSFGK